MDRLSKKEAVERLEAMGFKPRETHYGWVARVKCRLFGPHDWSSLMTMQKSGALVEEGRICEVCQKEEV